MRHTRNEWKQIRILTSHTLCKWPCNTGKVYYSAWSTDINGNKLALKHCNSSQKVIQIIILNLLWQKKNNANSAKGSWQTARKIQLKFMQFMTTHKRKPTNKRQTKRKNRTTHTTRRVEVAHSDTKIQLPLTLVTRNGKLKITIWKQLTTKTKTEV